MFPSIMADCVKGLTSRATNNTSSSSPSSNTISISHHHGELNNLKANKMKIPTGAQESSSPSAITSPVLSDNNGRHDDVDVTTSNTRTTGAIITTTTSSSSSSSSSSTSTDEINTATIICDTGSGGGTGGGVGLVNSCDGNKDQLKTTTRTFNKFSSSNKTTISTNINVTSEQCRSFAEAIAASAAATVNNSDIGGEQKANLSSCLFDEKTAQFVNDISNLSSNGICSTNGTSSSPPPTPTTTTTSFGSSTTIDSLQQLSNSSGVSLLSSHVCTVCHGRIRDPYKMTINDGCASGGINGHATSSTSSSSSGALPQCNHNHHCDPSNGSSFSSTAAVAVAEEELTKGCMSAQTETAVNDPLFSGYLGSWKKNRYLSGNFSVSGDTMEAIVQCLVFLKAFSVRLLKTVKTFQC